ncbi:uncharacterized protein LOC105785539 isoform X1 [Gossypium raimondii]|uniref:uncharacterized protein LOC105785539 isoform X1 n=1 Tax=Gossypium raimondii TaxID=29730 RepID=UPI00063A96F2|nr:uncharacterized protein LOC105785539 isoform X1 [Gossypium raimondii]
MIIPNTSYVLKNGQSAGTSGIPRPNGFIDDSLKDGQAQSVSEQEKYVAIVSAGNFARGAVDLGKSMLSVPAGFNNTNSLHFNPAFEDVAAIAVTINEALLDSNNHTAVTFQGTSISKMDGVKGVNENSDPGISFNSGIGRVSGGKTRGSKGDRKSNKTLKGPSNRFKAMVSSRVSLAGSMLMEADLISFKLDGQDAKEKVTKEIEGLGNDV